MAERACQVARRPARNPHDPRRTTRSGIEYRDQTDDQVMVDAANAIAKHGVGVKCATMTPDEARVREFNPQRNPNGTIGNILDGTIFLEPIICQNEGDRRCWCRASCCTGPSRSSSAAMPMARLLSRDRDKDPGRGKGHAELHPADDGPAPTLDVHTCKQGGAAMVIITRGRASRAAPGHRSTTRGCADGGCTSPPETRSSGARRLHHGHLPAHYDTKFKAEFDKWKLTYEHALIDDMVACVLKWNGGCVWACKIYDDDVQSDT
jgi:isocitrate dehydrogenase